MMVGLRKETGCQKYFFGYCSTRILVSTGIYNDVIFRTRELLDLQERKKNIFDPQDTHDFPVSLVPFFLIFSIVNKLWHCIGITRGADGGVRIIKNRGRRYRIKFWTFTGVACTEFIESK
jgi:hypothetical protein